MVGVDKPDATLSFSSYDVLFHGKTIMGSLYGGLKPKSDVPTLLKWYTDKVTSYCFFMRIFHINPTILLILESSTIRNLSWINL